jgi:hypothetical protein
MKANEYFENINYNAAEVERLGEQMLNAMAHAKDSVLEFIHDAEKAIALGDQNSIIAFANESELGGDTPEESVRLLIASAKETITECDRKMALLAQILE